MEIEHRIGSNINLKLRLEKEEQDRINRLFQELNALLPPLLPQFDEDDDYQNDSIKVHV